MKRKSVRIYSFTGTGSRLALNLAEKIKQEGYVCYRGGRNRDPCDRSVCKR